MSKVNSTDLLTRFQAASRKHSDASAFIHAVITKKAGLSEAGRIYLGLILHKSITVGEISKLSGLGIGAVTGLIDRLEK
ncbi:hypothetical protein [Flavobacterium sp. SORGH_AS_0622]|uniref:hypothetical protein n=1 Tax=Flavobacterium sp. SORGH_AS_0622 TaxID=3041772 RepID=UPI0027876A07|nr:hypothetical protein [Flavobacterium sp. SORGH_AS_0622]MDQ1166442.1 DNA-binding MarR family transcriptional regulator [Flavobacterium sp. SORGH_AS_0622]